MSPCGEDLAHRRRPQSRHAQQLFFRCAVYINRELLAKLQRPGEFGVNIERQVAIRFRRLRDLMRSVAVKAHQPVRLIQTMLAHQWRAFERQDRARIGDRRERAVIDAAQTERAVQLACLGHDIGITRIVGTHDHLCRLACRCKARRVFEAFAFILRLNDVRLGLGQRAFDLAFILVRREPAQSGTGGQFDIDRDTVCQHPCLMDQFGIGFGNGLEVDISAKVMLFAKDTRTFDHLLHRVVGALDDAG